MTAIQFCRMPGHWIQRLLHHRRANADARAPGDRDDDHALLTVCLCWDRVLKLKVFITQRVIIGTAFYWRR